MRGGRHPAASGSKKGSEGVVGTTGVTVPPDSLAEADDLCSQEFGAGWRVSEFHDGGAGPSRPLAVWGIRPNVFGSTSRISQERPEGFM